MKKIPLIDNLFSHATTSSWHNISHLMEWDRKNIDSYDYVVTTDPTININKKIYMWLMESPRITKNYYDYVKNNNLKFDKIFTFSKEILENYDNSFFTPIGGCWISEENRKIHLDEKNKILSMVSSGKMITEGHLLRKNIIDKFNNKFDLYGFNYKKIDNKIESLKNYMFQVVVENTKEDYYFTEKIIDCLQTGVIPIYWGCPSIDKFFDLDGILTFNTLDDLEKILSSLNEELYKTKIKSIIKNFQLSKNYLIAEDYMIKNYFNESN